MIDANLRHDFTALLAAARGLPAFTSSRAALVSGSDTFGTVSFVLSRNPASLAAAVTGPIARQLRNQAVTA